jgi:hypothetical protein
LEDDAAVAQVHAPAEFGYVAFSEAMVTVDATLDVAMAAGAISRDEQSLVHTRADAVFFKERTWRRIFDAVSSDMERPAERLQPHIRNIKRADAEALLDALLQRKHSGPLAKVSPAFSGWQFNETAQWRKLRV